MKKADLIKKLQEVKNMGPVPSARKGSTGVGYTFEKLLGIVESNIAIPDLGTIEVKAIRRDSDSLVTLFTFNRGVWKLKQEDIIRKYGYLDEEGRYALKNTLFYGRHIPQGLYIKIDKQNRFIEIFDNQNQLLGIFSLYIVVGKFYTKLGKILLAVAESYKDEKGQEYFHYTDSYLLSETTPENFINAFEKGAIGIDLRMHLKPNGGVRNRGTAFRIREKDLMELYSKKEKLT